MGLLPVKRNGVPVFRRLSQSLAYLHPLCKSWNERKPTSHRSEDPSQLKSLTRLSTQRFLLGTGAALFCAVGVATPLLLEPNEDITEPEHTDNWQVRFCGHEGNTVTGLPSQVSSGNLETPRRGFLPQSSNDGTLHLADASDEADGPLYRPEAHSKQTSADCKEIQHDNAKPIPRASPQETIRDVLPATLQIFCAPSAHKLCERQFLGTGFIYSPDGLVLTAAHVLEPLHGDGGSETPTLFVRLYDKRWYRCEVVGKSDEADVAVLRITTKSPKVFPHLALEQSGLNTSPSSQYQPGDTVVACGSTQYGDEPVACLGVISQTQQSFSTLQLPLNIRLMQLAMVALPDITTMVPLRTVYLGFSGSPVVDVNGRMAAMVVKKFEEYALAFPVTQLSAIAHFLEEHKTWSMPYLGVSLSNPAERLADDCGGPVLRGILVQAVAPESPAAKAGFLAGDKLLALDGNPLTCFYQVNTVLYYCPVVP